MFGRIRASPSPTEFLETEIPPSKLFKDTSLSIYEATLLKLKQGSKRSLRNLSPTCQGSMDFESNGDFTNVSPEVSGSCSRQGREMAICVLFSRYNKSHQKHEVVVENSSSTITSVSSSDSDSAGS